jgi:hypothetical protein
MGSTKTRGTMMSTTAMRKLRTRIILKRNESTNDAPLNTIYGNSKKPNEKCVDIMNTVKAWVVPFLCIALLSGCWFRAGVRGGDEDRGHGDFHDRR